MTHDDDVWEAIAARLPGLRRPARARGADRREVADRLNAIEREVARDPSAAFTWDERAGAQLTASGRTFQAGHFSTPSIGELESRARQRPASGAVSFSVLLGTHIHTDIGALQAMAGPQSLFQVASQFNCLEAPGPSLAAITDYVYDSTQGPRAAVSAFPGAFLRHYAAPAADGSRFTQTRGRQIDLLNAVADGAIAEVLNGYLRAGGISNPPAFESAVVERFDEIRIGVQDGIEVVYGRNWGGPVEAPAPAIAQVFTSTMALGMYSGGETQEFDATCRQLLRAAYLGTLLAAFDLGRQTVVLTQIGGGAFGNPPRTIWDAMLWAIDRASAMAPFDVTVVLNARIVDASIRHEEVLAATHARRGGVVNT